MTRKVADPARLQGRKLHGAARRALGLDETARTELKRAEVAMRRREVGIHLDGFEQERRRLLIALAGHGTGGEIAHDVGAIRPQLERALERLLGAWDQVLLLERERETVPGFDIVGLHRDSAAKALLGVAEASLVAEKVAEVVVGRRKGGIAEMPVR